MSKERGHKEVAALVNAHSGQKTGWDQGAPEDAQVAARVEALLKTGLDRTRAVQIALVNNPALQGTYEGLGVSQADMVQAGLLSNPTLSGSIGFPVSNGRPEYEGSIVQSFLDLFMLPARKRIATAQFEAEILRVAHETLRVAANVSQTFVEYQATVQWVELRRSVTQATAAAAEFAERQFESGGITDLALASERANYGQAKLDLAREELEATKRREALNRLLGLWGPRTEWSLAGQLPEVPAQEGALSDLESFAVRERLDIAAARKQALLMASAVGLARTSRLFGLVEVGMHLHQDPDGPRLWGPNLSLELPIFDQRQAMIGRLEAQQRQAERRLAELSIEARSEVRVARTELLTARQMVEHYQQSLLPLREQVVEQSQLQYNAMQIGLNQLLTARKDQIEAYRGYIGAVRDYWIARAELERALGGRIEQLGADHESAH